MCDGVNCMLSSQVQLQRHKVDTLDPHQTPFTARMATRRTAIFMFILPGSLALQGTGNEA